MSCSVFTGILVFEKNLIKQVEDKIEFKLYEPFSGMFSIRVVTKAALFERAMGNTPRTAPVMISVYGQMMQLVMDATMMNMVPCVPWIPEALIEVVQQSITAYPVELCPFFLSPKEKYYLVLQIRRKEDEDEVFKRPVTPPWRKSSHH